MASSSLMQCSSPIFNLPRNSSTLNRSNPFSVSFTTTFRRFNRLSVRSSSASAAPAGGLGPAISLTDDAVKHLKRIRSERGDDLRLRVGVKQGGCSGMSYTMDLESKENAGPDDSVIEHDGVTIDQNLCDVEELNAQAFSTEKCAID